MESKKASLIYILKTLEDESDSSHFLTQQEIIDLVAAKYGLRMERKAVARSLALLEEAGYDVNKDPKGGYALLSRTFDESEVSFLVDAIFSSKSISGGQAKKLCEEISSCLSVHDRKSFDYLYKSVDVNRTPNKDVFLNIESPLRSHPEEKENHFRLPPLWRGREDGEETRRVALPRRLRNIYFSPMKGRSSMVLPIWRGNRSHIRKKCGKESSKMASNRPPLALIEKPK
jgi:hypothetical protein